MPLTRHDMHQDMQVDLNMSRAKVNNIKQAYQLLSLAVSEHLNIPSQTLFDRLLDRENMASSGIGDGIAIPHLKFRRLHKPFTTLMTFDKPIEFHSIDVRPVDILCFIASPVSDGALHLRRLSRLTRLLRRQDISERLRETSDIETMRTIIMDPDGWLVAAA